MHLVLRVMIFFLSATPIALANETYTIAVIGTGNMGSALGQQFAAAGHTVTYGSRDPSRDKVKGLVAATGQKASATTQRASAEKSQIVVLAVPWSAVESLIPDLGDLSGKVIVDITTGDGQAADGYPDLVVESSTSELIRSWAPTALIVKTPFAGATTVSDPLRYGERPLTFIASDDREAKEITAKLAIQLGFFPLDAGPLRMARAIDNMGLLYLTPMIQGRPHTWSMLPRVDMDLSCVSTAGWFDSVIDEGNLAQFPNLESVETQCPKPATSALQD